MKYEIHFSSIYETEDDMHRVDALDVAERIAAYISEKSGFSIHAQDVDKIVEKE